jgi:hypothetical protein
MHEFRLMGGDSFGSVVLELASQNIRGVRADGTEIWSTRLREQFDSYVECGEPCDTAVFSSNMTTWYDLSVSDPQPRSFGPGGERLWSLAPSQKMRVLAGTSADDSMILRVDGAGQAWVEILVGGAVSSRIPLRTNNTDWTRSVDGRSGVLFEYNSQRGSTRAETFRRTGTTWIHVGTRFLDYPARAMCVSGDLATTVVFSTEPATILWTGDQTRRLETDVPYAGSCLIAHDTLAIVQRYRSKARVKTKVRVLATSGETRWRHDSQAEDRVSIHPMSGAVLLSNSTGTIEYSNGSAQVRSFPDAIAEYGRDGSVIVLQPDGTAIVVR